MSGTRATRWRKAIASGPEARPPPLLRWTLLCALAEAVGMTAVVGAVVATEWLVDEPMTAAGVAVAVTLVVSGGLVEGGALGAAQAAAVRRWLPGIAFPWILVTLAVAGLGWTAGAVPTVLADGGSGEPTGAVLVLAAVAVGAAMGAFLGAAQALVLRGRVRHPWRWVGANTLAWMASMAVIFVGAAGVPPGWSAPATIGVGTVTGLTAGAVLGLVTGWFLPSLSGTAPHNRLVLGLLRSRARSLVGGSLTGLRVRGVVSRTWFEFPVMYAVDRAGRLVVLVGWSERKRWWRNVRGRTPVAVLRHGAWHRSHARLLRPDDEGFGEALAAYRRHWRRLRVPAGSLLVLIDALGDPATQRSGISEGRGVRPNVGAEQGGR